MGEGWNLDVGHIERQFKPCSNSADLCYAGDNYSLSMNGVQSRLVRVGAPEANEFRLEDDNGWRVRKLFWRGQNFQLNQPIVGMARTPGGAGYWLVARDGGVFAFGDARFWGSTGSIRLNQPIVGMAATPSGNGYWLVAADGGIFAFGDAGFFGSMGGVPLNRPISGMAATPSGAGYWLVGGDGGIFNFGNAGHYGSMAGTPLNGAIVGMAGSPQGTGYWMVGSDGGVFSFNVGNYGSMAGAPLNRPMVGMAASPAGTGYWLVGGDGGIFAFNVPGYGSMGGVPLNQPVVGMAATPSGGGYWMTAADGGIFNFGNAGFYGSVAGLPHEVHPDAQSVYFDVTTTDGTVYRFGGNFQGGSLDRALNSVSTVPVSNPGTNDPCHGAAYSLCNMAWRWGLDEVDDTNGNVESIFWRNDINYYNARGLNLAANWAYNRAAEPDYIDYGLTSTNKSGQAPSRVKFNYVPRCRGACSWPADYPDSPTDQVCNPTGACPNTSPAFYNSESLGTVTTNVWGASAAPFLAQGAFNQVARYQMSAPDFPTHADGSQARLWLNNMQRFGADNTTSFPAMTFDRIELQNRVDVCCGVSPMSMWRISGVRNELGAVTTIGYTRPYPCSTADFPITFTDWHKDCFPAWVTVDSTSQGWGIFNKYSVTIVQTASGYGSTGTQQTYSYDPPSWHYGDDPVLPDNNACTCRTRTWDDYRGHAKVGASDGSNNPSDNRFYRGMNGDRANSAGTVTKSVTVAATDNSQLVDSNFLAGQQFDEVDRDVFSNVLRRDFRDLSGRLNSAPGNPASGVPEARMLLLDEKQEQVGGPTAPVLRTVYAYDQYGNVTRWTTWATRPRPLTTAPS